MIKKDYSKDILETQYMLSEEMLDYDTLRHNWTGINDGRMRLPTRYDISKKYMRNKRNRGKHKAGEYGKWVNKSAEELIDFSDDFEWQITYAFPATLRNPVTQNGAVYGGENVTFRRLYLILCEHFNDHVYFVDEYFESVYPYTIKPEVDLRLKTVKEELLEVAETMTDVDFFNELNAEEGIGEVKLNNDGSLSASARKRNRSISKALDEYEKFAKEWEESEGEDVARMIREDIIGCITSGQLPCQFAHFPAKSTIENRLRAGLGAVPIFSATEQLIRSIQLFVNIGGNRKWHTQSGLMV